MKRGGENLGSLANHRLGNQIAILDVVEQDVEQFSLDRRHPTWTLLRNRGRPAFAILLSQGGRAQRGEDFRKVPSPRYARLSLSRKFHCRTKCNHDLMSARFQSRRTCVVKQQILGKRCILPHPQTHPSRYSSMSGVVARRSPDHRSMLLAMPASAVTKDDLPPTGVGSENLEPASIKDMLYAWVVQWGSAVVDSVESIGDLALFAWHMVTWIVTRLPQRGTMLINFYRIGVLSLPVVALTGTFIGMVLAVQSYYQFHAIGLESRLGVVINTTLVRELGPVLAATMLAGRVGSAMAAVLGTMRVTEQIDALTAMGADPIHYLVVPRFLACILLIPALTIMADFMGIVGGYFYSVMVLDIDHAAYLTHSREGVVGFDLFSGIFKSIFFGAIIAVVSCYQGFHCRPGAEGVGRAATSAFVISFVLILAIDLMLNIILDEIYFMIYPAGSNML